MWQSITDGEPRQASLHSLVLCKLQNCSKNFAKNSKKLIMLNNIKANLINQLACRNTKSGQLLIIYQVFYWWSLKLINFHRHRTHWCRLYYKQKHYIIHSEDQSNTVDISYKITLSLTRTSFTNDLLSLLHYPWKPSCCNDTLQPSWAIKVSSWKAELRMESMFQTTKNFDFCINLNVVTSLRYNEA